MHQLDKRNNSLFLVLVALMLSAGCSLSDPYTCKPNSQRCDATLGFQICDANGEWGSHYACSHCDDTKCEDPSLAKCDQNGKFKCISKDDVSIALTCTNNHWIPLVCNSGVCTDEMGCSEAETRKYNKTTLCVETTQNESDSSITYSYIAKYGSSNEWQTSPCLPGKGCNGNECKQDTNNDCGETNADCTKIENANTVKCDARQCKATSCNAGYHLNKNNCVNNTNDECGSETNSCGEHEVCDTDKGECKPIKPCTDDPSVCGNEYLCEDGECYTIDSTYHTPDIPAFCEEKATIQFLIDNYEYIFKLLDALKDSHDKETPETDACDEYLVLEKLFNEQGSQVCKQLLSCSVGSSRSFMTCTSHFLNESFKHGSIKNYINALNIKPELINNLDNVNSIFSEKEYKQIHYLLFKQFNGVTQKSICHTCTYDPSICTQNETCTNHNCIRKGKDYPDYCDNYLVIKFFLDHYDLYHDLMSNNLDIQTNAYQKLISLYSLYLEDLCRQMGDGCLYIDNETMNQCIKRILNNITSNDNLKDYLHDLEDIFISIQNFKMIRYEENLCYIYNLLNDDCSLFNGHKVLQFRNALTNTSNTPTITCDTSPEICQEEESCTNNECTDKSGTPRYCNYQPMVWFMLDHFDLINDIAGTDSNAACNSYNRLLELYKTEGKHACSITSGCQTGNDDNFNKCIINMLLELSDYSMPDYINYYAPGYNETKAQSLNASYSDTSYDINHLDHMIGVFNDKICSDNIQP